MFGSSCQFSKPLITNHLPLITGFLSDKFICAVTFPQCRFLNLACRISWNFCENNFARTFISRQVAAKIIYLFLRASHTFLDFDNRRRNFTKSPVRQADNRNVFDFVESVQKVFNLHGINIFAAADYNIFLPVYQKIKSVRVLHCHIACQKPVVLQNFRR